MRISANNKDKDFVDWGAFVEVFLNGVHIQNAVMADEGGGRVTRVKQKPDGTMMLDRDYVHLEELTGKVEIKLRPRVPLVVDILYHNKRKNDKK